MKSTLAGNIKSKQPDYPFLVVHNGHGNPMWKGNVVLATSNDEGVMVHVADNGYGSLSERVIRLNLFNNGVMSSTWEMFNGEVILKN